MTDSTNPDLALSEDDRETLLSHGVDITGIELDPVDGARGYHIATWIDGEIELEFMVTKDAPIRGIVDTFFDSVARNARMVSPDTHVVVAAVDVQISGGHLEFGPDEVARRETSSDWSFENA